MIAFSELDFERGGFTAGDSILGVQPPHEFELEPVVAATRAPPMPFDVMIVKADTEQSEPGVYVFCPETPCLYVDDVPVALAPEWGQTGPWRRLSVFPSMLEGVWVHVNADFECPYNSTFGFRWSTPSTTSGDIQIAAVVEQQVGESKTDVVRTLRQLARGVLLVHTSGVAFNVSQLVPPGGSGYGHPGNHVGLFPVWNWKTLHESPRGYSGSFLGVRVLGDCIGGSAG